MFVRSRPMYWSNPIAEQVSRQWRKRLFLEHSGSFLLLCSAASAAGLYQGILTLTQVACYFVAGLFWAKYIVQSLSPPAGKRINWEFFFLIFSMTGIAKLNRYHPDSASLWEYVAQTTCWVVCHVGCLFVTMFLTFWLFREVFVRHIDPSSSLRS